MADEPISALTLLTSYSIADEIEILDVSDTTFASTGTNKRIQFSTLLTMAGVGTVAGGGTGLTAAGSADQLLGVQHTGGGLEYKTLTAGANITNTPAAGSITIASTASGGGLTSVGLSTPSWLTVSNSPLTSNGTLAVSATTGETANQVLATPNGSSGAVGLRSIVAADLPTVPTSGGGTGLTSIGTADQVLGVAHTGGALEYKTLTAGANVTITDAAGQITIASSGTGGGTVNSVGLSTPSWLTVTGSPITGSGTLAVTATTGVTANQVLATPNGSSGALAVRALVAADIPSLPASQITSGQLGVANGGTGQATQAAAFNALSPITALGDIIYGSGVNAATNLAGNITRLPKALLQTGTGSASACPIWTPVPLVVWRQTAAGTAVANSTALTSILQGGTQVGAFANSLTFPAGILNVLGTIVSIDLYGTWGCTASQPTLLVQLSLGGVIFLQSTAVVVSSANAATGGFWSLSCNQGQTGFMVQGTGSSGKIMGNGWRLLSQSSGAGTPGITPCLSTSGTPYMANTQVTVDLTSAQTLDVKVQWGTANSANTYQVLGGSVTLMGVS